MKMNLLKAPEHTRSPLWIPLHHETKNNLRAFSILVSLLRMHETVPEERISNWWQIKLEALGKF